MTEFLVVIVLALIAIGAIAFPFLTGVIRYEDPEELEADVQQYREALRAGTVCDNCRAPNDPGSRYCTECGRALG